MENFYWAIIDKVFMHGKFIFLEFFCKTIDQSNHKKSQECNSMQISVENLGKNYD